MAPILGYRCIDGIDLADSSSTFRCDEQVAGTMLSIPLRWCHADSRFCAHSRNAKAHMAN